MAASLRLRTFLHVPRALALKCIFGHLPVQLTSPCLHGLRTVTPNNSETESEVGLENKSLLENATITPKKSTSKSVAGSENKSLLENLNIMGVDLKRVRQRQPAILRRSFTNEQGVARFLQGKGASRNVIASIISRYPRSITRSDMHMEEQWALWRSFFDSDEEIIRVLDRSPEAFFRCSDNKNLESNIQFLTSLGLDSKALHRLLTTAPRTFSNTVSLNKQMVELLEDVCSELGGEDPARFAKTVISRNVYILIRSTKRVKTNIDNIKASLKLSSSELLALLQGAGAEILDLSNEYLTNNFESLKQKMLLHGGQKTDVKRLVLTYPMVLFVGSNTLNSKLDCLLEGGITLKQIVAKPRVLEFSTKNITERIAELQRLGYDFERNGINILDLSRKRFDAKIERLTASQD